MNNNGVFITLYDEESLYLYLYKGIYGFLMKPVYEQVSSCSNHYKALADYGCLREGSHVFFFLKREIVYGGQIIGNISDGSFYINGPYSPLGRESNSDIYWDESKRQRYVKTCKEGIFKIDEEEKCQPFIVKFKDDNNLKGKCISSDELYFELGKYPYPLPSNAIQNMGFCILTPGETHIAIELLMNSSNKKIINCNEHIELNDDIALYNNTFGVQSLKEDNILSESHLEFSLLSNSKLLSKLIKLPNNYTLSRQVPISPFKPNQMDRADICIYDIKEPIRDGTLPNIIIELKKDKANYKAIEQVTRYLRWLEMIIDDDKIFKNIKAYIVSAGITRGTEELLKNCKYSDMIEIVNYKSV